MPSAYPEKAVTAAIRKVLPLLFFGAAWQIASQLKMVDPAFLPGPIAVGRAFFDLLQSNGIAGDVAVTLFRTFLGLIIGSTLGILLGASMARSEKVHAYAAPLVGATYSLPKSAVIPLLILWFGIGTMTSVCAVALACLLPLVVQTYHGVSTTPKVLVWGAEALGSSSGTIFRRVYLPHAMPDIFTGLRMALGFAFVLAISSEMIASTSGIGRRIFMYGENGSYDYMFAAVACIVLVAFISDRVLLAITRYVLRWHESSAHETTL